MRFHAIFDPTVTSAFCSLYDLPIIRHFLIFFKRTNFFIQISLNPKWYGLFGQLRRRGGSKWPTGQEINWHYSEGHPKVKIILSKMNYFIAVNVSPKFWLFNLTTSMEFVPKQWDNSAWSQACAIWEFLFGFE